MSPTPRPRVATPSRLVGVLALILGFAPGCGEESPVGPPAPAPIELYSDRVDTRLNTMAAVPGRTRTHEEASVAERDIALSCRTVLDEPSGSAAVFLEATGGLQNSGTSVRHDAAVGWDVDALISRTRQATAIGRVEAEVRENFRIREPVRVRIVASPAGLPGDPRWEAAASAQITRVVDGEEELVGREVWGVEGGELVRDLDPGFYSLSGGFHLTASPSGESAEARLSLALAMSVRVLLDSGKGARP